MYDLYHMSTVLRSRAGQVHFEKLLMPDFQHAGSAACMMLMVMGMLMTVPILVLLTMV